MYEVALSPQAEKFFSRADKPLAKKMARCYRQLEQDPYRYPNIKPSKGTLAGYYRFRVGDHRVVYRIDSSKKSVVVALVAHRSEAYE